MGIGTIVRRVLTEVFTDKTPAVELGLDERGALWVHDTSPTFILTGAVAVEQNAAAAGPLAAYAVACVTGLVAAPLRDVAVFVGGCIVALSGDRAGLWYLSGDGGATARALGAAQLGDVLCVGAGQPTLPLTIAGAVVSFLYSY